MTSHTESCLEMGKSVLHVICQQAGIGKGLEVVLAKVSSQLDRRRYLRLCIVSWQNYVIPSIIWDMIDDTYG